MGSTSVIALVLRPLVLIAFIALIALLSSLIRRAIPAGRVKAFLTRPMHVIPQEGEPHSWRPFVILVLLSALLWGGVAWMISAA